MAYTARAVAIVFFLGGASGIRDGFDVQEGSESRVSLNLDGSVHAIVLDASSAQVQATRTKGWPNVSDVMSNGTDQQKSDLLEPVLKAVLQGYGATHGSYRSASMVDACILGRGWERLRDLEADPPGGGMHALVFWHADTQRGLVVFRGSDLGDNRVSRHADFCGQKVLFEGAGFEELPSPERDGWSMYQLDYLRQAQGVVRKVLVKLGKETRLLLVGHSLGAGLAAIVAGTWKKPSNAKDGR